MKNFNWTSFTRRIEIKASIKYLYDAWTKSEEIEKWFLSKANFYNLDQKMVAKNESIKTGFTYEWSWYLYDDLEKGKITEANEKDFLQFTFAGECLVDIRLTQQGDYVIVELTQKNIPTDDHSKHQIRLGCDSGWSFYLVNLKSVYEGGLDLRNKNPEFKRMLNN
ncbi:MAG: SRPBCC domain-containing protein [Saprospiraceae bacterium]